MNNGGHVYADIGFTSEAVDRMLTFDEDVVAGLYPLKVVRYDAAVPARLQAGESLETAQPCYVQIAGEQSRGGAG